jgi:hypothetical protein
MRLRPVKRSRVSLRSLPTLWGSGRLRHGRRPKLASWVRTPIRPSSIFLTGESRACARRGCRSSEGQQAGAPGVWPVSRAASGTGAHDPKPLGDRLGPPPLAGSPREAAHPITLNANYRFPPTQPSPSRSSMTGLRRLQPAAWRKQRPFARPLGGRAKSI